MRNQFNLSHEHKTSVDMGQLIPVMCEEVLPGDTFIHSASALARIAPLAKPLMHRVELRLHTFYCPNRILWTGWEDFITGKSSDPKPEITTTGTNEEVLDYLGIPPKVGLDIDALPVRMLNLVWNEYYRDQDLQTERAIEDMTVPRCAWQKDYFTVARAQPQQGDAAGIPVSGTGRIYKTNASIPASTDLQVFFNTDNVDPTRESGVFSDGTNVQRMVSEMGDAFISIDDFRREMALQRFAEARMRFGSRYVDYLRYMGVNPSDGRLDRPEYLGGGKEVISFSEVLSTAQGTTTDVGDMFGHGIAMGRQARFRKMFEEHGWVMTFLSVRPKTVYVDNVPRKFIRRTAMDYYQKELEVLPWQEVSQLEIHKDGDEAQVWGYVPRYEEYRHGVSHVSGTLRNGTENDWHMAREFASPPTLNGSFIECTPTDRVYQDTNQPELIVNVMHNLQARRIVGAMASMGQDI